MQQNPITDKELMITKKWDDEKYRDVRHSVANVVNLAMDEYIKRKVKKEKKKSDEALPIAPGKMVVASYEKKSKKYYVLVEIVDFKLEKSWGSNIIKYYGILTGITNIENKDRIGRLINLTNEKYMGWHRQNYSIEEKIKASDINWLTNLE